MSNLLKILDEAAEKLLSEAGLDAAAEFAEQPATADLAEKVKAFQAVASWADKRREIAPQAPKESQIDKMRKQMHGDDPGPKTPK